MCQRQRVIVMNGENQIQLEKTTFFSASDSSYSKINYFFTYKRDVCRIRHFEIGVMDLYDDSPVYMDLEIKNKKNTFSLRMNSNVLKGQKKS